MRFDSQTLRDPMAEWENFTDCVRLPTDAML